jgi:hypothetical protein
LGQGGFLEIQVLKKISSQVAPPTLVFSSFFSQKPQELRKIRRKEERRRRTRDRLYTCLAGRGAAVRQRSWRNQHRASRGPSETIPIFITLTVSFIRIKGFVFICTHQLGGFFWRGGKCRSIGFEGLFLSDLGENASD